MKCYWKSAAACWIFLLRLVFCDTLDGRDIASTSHFTNSCASHVNSLRTENERLQQELDMFKHTNSELQLRMNSLSEQCHFKTCESKGVSYADGDIWYPDPCTTCRCEVDKINCYTSFHSPYCELKCNQNTCLNGGVCLGSLDNNSIQCSCPDGFSGPLCEQSIANCDPVSLPGECYHGQAIWYFDSYSNQCKSTTSGCYKPWSTFSSFEACSSSCLQGTCCYRMKIGEVMDMICQAETMKNCQVLCHDSNVEVLGFYPGIKCPNEGCAMIASRVCHTGISLYSPGAKFSFGCDSCECMDERITCSCTRLSVRREIRSLSPSERSRFQRAVSRLQSNGVWTSLRHLYATHAMHAASPQHFLLWHRLLLRTLERHLQEEDCAVTLPYFDFTLDAADLANSAAWRTDFFGEPCSGVSSPCPKRNLRKGGLPTMVDVALALAKPDFMEFTSALRGIVDYVHDFIGGDMATTNAPMDPIFYSFHAYIDFLLWQWQRRHSNGDLQKLAYVLNTTLVPFNIKQRFLLDSERDLCVSYSFENGKEQEFDRNSNEFESECMNNACDNEFTELLNVGHRVQSVLFSQEEGFLKTLPRTCSPPSNNPRGFINQAWNVHPNDFEIQKNFQSTSLKNELCDRFCFTADIFLPSESIDQEEFSCKDYQEEIPICEESSLLKCPFYTYAPCRLSLCGNCSLICHVGGEDVKCEDDKTDFCQPNPCQNGGECVTSRWPGLPHLVSCNCPPGFEGQHCELEARQRCSLPLETGKACGHPEKRWYFDVRRGDCFSFVYEGCGGNANNFPSYYECRVACRVGACCWKEPKNPDRVPGYDIHGYDRYGFSENGRSVKNELQTAENGFGGDRAIFRFQNYDYQGYNRSGYNKDGIDRSGYKPDGFHHITKLNNFGYDVFGDHKGVGGFNEFGFNEDGFNRAGFNCQGYSKDGWDKFGHSAGWTYSCRSMNQKDCQKMERESRTPFLQVVSFSPGKKCEDVQCEEQCGCSFLKNSIAIGATLPLGCSVCTCTSSGRLNCPCRTTTVRKEIRDLTAEELKRYQNTIKVLALQSRPTTWENITELYREFLPQARDSTLFLPWHRFFLRFVEMKLQEIDCSVTIPYFDWTLDVGKLDASVVWQSNYFGGDGDSNEGNCVRNHPFKNYHPTYWNSCLRRQMNSTVLLATAVDIEKILRLQSFDEFSLQMQKISSLFHLFVGGHMATLDASYDPIFYSHYAFIDKLWNDWIGKDRTNIQKFPPKLRYVPLVPFAVVPDDVFQTWQLCVTYKDITEGSPCIYGDNVGNNNVKPPVVDVNGFDSEGYDISGYDRMGWTREGMFRNAFDRDGYDSSGFDINGFNRFGFSRNGCNSRGHCNAAYFNGHHNVDENSAWEDFDELGYRSNGFDFHGYDFFGFDLNGYDKENCSYFYRGPFYPIFMKQAREKLKSLQNEELDKVVSLCPYVSEVPDWWLELYWLNRCTDEGKVLQSQYAKNVYSPFSSKDMWLAPTPDQRFCFSLQSHSRCGLSSPPVPCPFHQCEPCPTLPSARCRSFGCGSCDTDHLNVVTLNPTSCNKNDCISVDGIVKKNGEVWEEDLCYTCACQSGMVSCSAVHCETNCDHPIPLSGSCCPVCDGCSKDGVEYSNGARFMDPRNPCLRCECRDGSVLCSTLDCAPPGPCPQAALLTLPGECCPTCSMCGPHHQGTYWMESPCHNCTCQAGQVKCNVISCPMPTCQYPARTNDECCRHCDDCDYRGTYVKDDETFYPEPCVECKCKKGNVSCKKMDCLHRVCIDRNRNFEQCCDQCWKGCQYDGREYEDGNDFTPSFNPCLSCSCKKGIVRCQPSKCPKPDVTCAVPVFKPGGCCPECPKCMFENKEYTNGQRWKISEDSCESCVCMNGIVTCSEKETCPDQKCTHGVIPPGQCCSPCIDCQYNSHLVSDRMQFSPPDDPCARCVCQRGNITCVRETCPQLRCRATHLPQGACCPVCKGCVNHKNQPIEYGEKWVHHADVCQICTCLDGSIKCDRITCKVTCTHPVKKADLCCPECKGCQVLGRVYEPNAEIPTNNQCQRCHCYHGNMECESIRCPVLTCANPKKESGVCCPTCEECNFQGLTYRDQEKFQPKSDPCYSCTCEKGAVHCDRRDDRCNPQCKNPVRHPGQCCPVCDGCQYESHVLRNREVFTPNPDEPCLQCQCTNGNVGCFQKQCPRLSCPHKVRPPKQCCEECVEYCVVQGDADGKSTYQEGETWVAPDDRCSLCTCEAGVVRCERMSCGPTAGRCLHPAAPFGVCCPECEHCEFTHRLYRNEQEFTHEEDPCQRCKCENGTVTCETVVCDPVPCAYPEPLEGLCCPLCSPEQAPCQVDGRTYGPWENFLDPNDPCSECVCVDGIFSCHPVLCLNTECANPQVGQCCESCEGCSYGEKNYLNHIEFHDPHNTCRDCRCENGVVSCQQPSCGGPLPCEYPILMPGDCCPTCRPECEYKGERYFDGETFVDPDDCSACVCRFPEVLCKSDTCSDCVDSPCQQRKLAESCQFFDDVKESGSVFTHPENPCEVCSCQGGMVTCFERECCGGGCGGGCRFEGAVYGEGQTFPDPHNSCQDCSCQGGNVTCRTRQCPVAPCNHPDSDGCCPKCLDCFYRNEHVSNGKSPKVVESCETCLCVNGNVECKSRECETVQCSHPVIEECCAVCNAGCDIDGNIFQSGERIPNPKKPCKVCICKDGNIDCFDKPCKKADCLHPVIKDCCPSCESDCLYDNQLVSNGQRLQIGRPCEDCLCRNGTVECKVKTCDKVTCTHPILRDCCPVCDAGCFFHGEVLKVGNKVKGQDDPCEICECINGSVICKPKTCDIVYCSNPIINDCCPVCELGCFYEGKVYDIGVEFDHPNDPCSECVCMKGTVYCNPKPCATPACVNMIEDDDHCCPYCPDYCEHKGEVYALGDTFLQEPCELCSCINGDIHCEVLSCPLVSCLHPAPGPCCPECEDCSFHGELYSNNANFTHPENPCETCLCSKGQVACEKTPCLQCLHPIANDSQCCPVCDGCFYAGMNITNQQRFIAPQDPCQECICKNGSVTCHPLSCSLPSCANPVVSPDVCCPVCPGCVISGIQFEEAREFTHPEDVCKKCLCQDSSIVCRLQTCERNCSHPLPDPCCPQCDGCSFESASYQNGEEFHPDLCRTCRCKDGNVVCVTESCPELTCLSRVRLPGQCCETCRGCVHEGVERENEAAWISPSNPCLSCKCQGGTPSCSNIVCPVHCSDPIPVPGRCCPVCPDCEQDGVRYLSGERFSPEARPCDSCTCDAGRIFCLRHECPALPGCPADAVRPPAPGRCCPECAAFAAPCHRRGQIGRPHPDPCFICQCSDNFMWECTREFCAPLNCPSEEVIKNEKECCLKCRVCISDNQEIHLHEDSWVSPNDPCNICSCDFGRIECKRLECPELQCEAGQSEFRTPGDCCPICASLSDFACFYGAAYYEHGQSWKPDPCTTCQCLQGKMSCHNERCLPLLCSSDEIRSVDPGQCCPKCIQRPATCLAFGDPHYRTFDGAAISFQGTCRYVLTADCYTQKFSIVVENNNRGLHGVSWTHRVVVVLQNASVDLRAGPSLYVRGRHIERLPYFQDPVLYVEKTGQSLLVTTDVGVKVLWNGDGFVEVTVSGDYRGKTCGLCGNFNNFPEDDMRTPNNVTVTSEAKFGDSWKYGENQPSGCTESADIDPCSKGGYRIRKIANTKCSILKQSLFSDCHRFVGPEPFFAACVYDVCACSQKDDCLCDILTAYSQECAKAGLVLNWRSEGLCGIKCEEGLVFDECGPPCARTCENRGLPLRLLAEQCFKPCAPGCQCSADKVLHDGRCISESQCPL